MRKELLINLLLQYKRDAAFGLIPKNPRIVLLDEFLESPQIAELPASAEITFEQFEAYLKRQNQDPASLFSLAYFRSGIRSVNVFIKFKYGIMDADLKIAIRNIPIPKVEWHETTGPFPRIPAAVRQVIYNEYLSNHDIGRLARVSSFFKTDTQANDIWIERLIKLDCNRDILLQLKEANIISDYKMLYKNIKSFYEENLIHIKFLWQLLCLSGELKAIHFGLKSGEINKETRDNSKVAPIHYLACIGQVAGLQLLKERLAVKMDAVTSKLENILHYAAMGNSPAAMQYALDQNISKNSLDSNGCNALHFACASGAEASLKFALDVLKLDGKQCDQDGYNALHLAIMNQNKKGILLALNLLKLSPKLNVRPQDDSYTCDALHMAAVHSSIEILKFIQNELKIPYDSRDSDSNSILHYASEGGSPEMMHFIVRELGIDANVRGGCDKTPLHTAALGGNVSCIKYGVLELNMNLYSEDRSGRTPMYFAIANKMKSAIIALREVGYDANHPDKNNRTAFDYLNAMQNLSIVERAALLEALTCNVNIDEKLRAQGEGQEMGGVKRLT